VFKLRRLGKVTSRLLSKTDPGDLAGFRGTGSCISFRTVFGLIDDQELAGTTLGPFESQPDRSRSDGSAFISSFRSNFLT
jgi:hypothetical protein